MKAKEIIILMVTFVTIFVLSTWSTYSLLNNSKKQTKDVLMLEEYTLNYGKYKGYQPIFNFNKQKFEKKKKIIVLTK